MTFYTGRDGTPIIGIAGWKNSGKTTLTERLVGEFARRGLRVSTLKHTHHDVQIDNADTDSARHRRAGASQVAILSRDRWAVVTELRGAPEPDFASSVALLEPADLLIVEGYKSAPIRKIELRRTASPTGDFLAPEDPLVVAIAADHATDTHGLPLFALDDIAGIAGFIARLCGLGDRSQRARPATPSAIGTGQSPVRAPDKTD